MSVDLDLALEACRYLESVAVATPDGVHWPEGRERDLGFYGGTSGAMLPLLEAAAVTGDDRWLQVAVRAGDQLIAEVETVAEPGLYSGLAGAGFALTELARLDAGERFRAAALRVVDLLRKRAVPVGGGVEWPDATYTATDIIAGGAGIGLFLLYAGQALGMEVDDLVAGAAARLVDLAESTAGGLDWAMGLPGFVHMPNFSHGTAGIGYFLCKAAARLGEPTLLDVALRGADHLLAIAITDGGVCAVQRNDPPKPGEPGPRFQRGWCHGAAGTAAFWHQLWTQTGDERWRDVMGASVRTLLPDTLQGHEVYPESDADGMMASFNYCHGSSGNAPFLLQASSLLHEPSFAVHGEALLADCRGRATRTAAGASWLAEGSALATFANGTAGVAYGLLTADAHRAGRAMQVIRPDDPFGALTYAPI